MGSKILGFLSPVVGIAQSMNKDEPKASGDAAKNVEAQKRKAKASRSSLYQTQGGVVGEEVETVGKRNSLLGN